ncbi:nucleotidyltransferase domain-containing protein [Streptomyces sp. NPDC048737]|uniref:nucleotidyltransferase domain-containing protein n=1 Tax=unclassified Streptomyces TaxID=2593676 RepID=UPI00343F18F2
MADEKGRTGPAGVSAERRDEVRSVVRRVTRWAAGREDVVGVLLVGSWARGAGRADLDVDLLVLTVEPGRYVAEDTRGASRPWES